MTEFVRPSGVRIDIPDAFRIGQVAPRTVRRGPSLPTGPIPLAAGGPAGGDDDALLQALGAHGLETIDILSLQPTAEPTPRRGVRSAAAAPIPETQSTAIDVDVVPDEHAVLLIEQDGMYAWSFPEEAATIPVSQGRLRRGHGSTTIKRLTFRVDVHATPVGGPATRSGLIAHLVYDRVKAFVLKYAAHVIVHEGLEYLESGARETLLVIDSLDPTAWGSVDDGVPIRFPQGRPARVLLLVHGTFSSTVGSYGGLASTPWGEQFIEAVKANYDIVLGFDHFTLKRDPAQNAQTLVSSLERISWPKGTQIDIVAFSRGGLVVRCLMDQLTPSLKELVRFQRAIFVACTNEGTRLADPDRIRAFIDLYTNLATAACRLMGMLPQAKAVFFILKELTKGLASLVKYIAANALADGAVPGLAAMQPGGAFLQRLDRPSDTKSVFAESLNYVITSEFVPRLTGDDVEPKELPARFLATIGEGFVRQLMKEGNDLVVGTSSMGTLPPIPKQLVHDRFDFGKTPKVYHTIYFLRPEVVGAITRWLELVKPESLAVPTPADVAKPAPGRRGGTRRGGTRRGGTRGPKPAATPVIPEIMLDLPELQRLPAQVDPRFTIAPADAPVEEILELIGQSPSPYVVVRRFHGADTLHYGMSTDDLLRAAERAAPGATLGQVLKLREDDASDERPASNPGAAADRPAVVLSGQHVVGVIPAAEGSSLDIVEMAKAALWPADPASAAAAQRAMPPLRSAPAAATATLYMRGEMDDEVAVNQATTIDVTIAREVIGGFISAVARKINVQAIPRSQFKILGEDRYEIDAPPPEKPWTGSFDVKASAIGDGEIWIVLSQDQATLASLILNPKVVENKRRDARMAARANAASDAAPAAIDQLLIVEQRNGDEITLFFQLQSPSLGVIDKYVSPSFKVEPRQYVKDLYHKIEERWVSSAQDAADFTVELKSVGADLLTELFPEKLRAKLWAARDQLKKIMVISTEPFIPWELVHLKEPDNPLGDDMHFLAQKGVVRWLHQAGWPRPCRSASGAGACAT